MTNRSDLERCTRCGDPLSVKRTGLHLQIGCAACGVSRWYVPAPKAAPRDARRCSTCGAPLLWQGTQSGRRIPLDYHETTIVTAEGQVVRGHTTHFATCPHADKHRKRGKK